MRDLREARRARGLRQEDVARAVGEHQSTISRRERKVIPTSPERLDELLAAIEIQEPLDPDAELLHDLSRPLPELKLESEAVHALLTAIVTELAAGGDRERLARIADLAISRQRRILECLNLRVASLNPS
jgi:transcriptional regulator with XRE-family HTH domain